MSANDQSVTAAVAGSLAIAGVGAGGAAVSVNTIVASTTATISGSTVTAAGDLHIDAATVAIVANLAAGAQIAYKQENSGAVGGSIAVNTLVQTTKSVIDDSSSITAGGDIALTSTNQSWGGAIAGAVQYAGGGTGGAAVAVNSIIRTTGSLLQASSMTASGNLTVTADNKAGIGAGAVGLGIGGKFALGGSIAVNTLVDTTSAAIDNCTLIETGGDLQVTARELAVVAALAGAAQFSGSTSVGPAVAVNTLVATTDAHVDHSTVHAKGDVRLEAENLEVVAGLAVGVQGAKEYALGGSVAVNTVVNTTTAAVRNGSTIYAGDDVALHADDASYVFSGAGGLQIALENAAAGAAVAVNTLIDTTRALVDTSSVAAGGRIAVDADNRCIVGNLAVGLQGAKQFALGGSVAVNTIVKTTEALATGTNVNPARLQAWGDINLSADDLSVIGNGSGSVQISTGTAAVGAAVAVNTVVNTVRSLAEQANLHTGTLVFDPAATVADATDTITFTLPHHLNSGDQLVYHGNGNLGLAHDITYYVIKVDDHSIRLAATSALATAGTHLNLIRPATAGEHSFSQPAKRLAFDLTTLTVNSAANTLTFTANHGFQQGELVQFTNPDGSIDGLTDGRTYVVIVVNSTTIKLAETKDLAAAGTGIDITLAGNGASTFTKTDTYVFDAKTAVDAATDTIVFTSAHHLQTGDAVYYAIGSGENLGGLTAQSTYYVIVVDQYRIRLAATAAQATAGTALALTPLATSSNQSLQNNRDLSFAPVTAVASTADSITFTAAHNLSNGDAVVYRDHGSWRLQGLVEGQTYYVGVVDATTIKLFATAAETSIDHARPVDLRYDSSATGTGMSLETASGRLALAASSLGVIGNLAVGGQFADSFAAGGSLAVNTLVNTTESVLDGCQVRATQDVCLNAQDLTVVGGLAGSVRIAKSGSVGAAVSVGTVVDTVTARIGGGSIHAGGDILLDADQAVVVGNLAVSGSYGQNFTVGGSVAVTTLVDTAQACIDGAAVVQAGNDIALKAHNGSVTIGGAGAVQGSNGASLGGAIAVATVVDTVSARIENSTVTAGNSLTMDADQSSILASLAASGQLGRYFTTSASVAVNTVVNTTEASITGSTVTATSGDIELTALDTSVIGSVVGSVGFSWGGGSIGAAVAVNTLTARTIALVEESSLTAGNDIRLAARNTAVIGNLAVSGMASQYASIGGAVSVNTIANTTEAFLQDNGSSNRKIDADGDVTLAADDSSVIGAVAAGLSANVTPSGPVAGSLGISTAVSVIDNQCRTFFEGVEVIAGDTIALDADASSLIGSVAVAGAGGFSGGFLGTGAGAVSVNVIDTTVESSIGEGSQVTTETGSVTLAADDRSLIVAIGGALSLGFAFGGVGGVGATVGASVAINVVNKTVRSSIEEESEINSGNALSVNAASATEVVAVTVAGSGGGSGGGTAGILLAGAGSVSVNTVVNDVIAMIADSDAVAQGAVNLAATDQAEIIAVGGSLAVAGTGGAIGGVSGAVGASVAVNTITGTTQASIAGSTVTARAIDQTAKSTAHILAVTVAGAGGGGGGAVGAVVGIGSGAGSGNTVRKTVEAVIGDTAASGRSIVTVTNGGSLRLSAHDQTNIEAIAGSISIGGGGGAVGAVAVSVGASAATNLIENTTRAVIDHADVTVPQQINLDAESSASILAVSAAGAISGGGGAIGAVVNSSTGAGSGNTVRNTIKAAIEDSNVSTTSQSIILSAEDKASITAVSGTAMAAGGGGIVGGVGGTVGASVAYNLIDNQVEAIIVRSDIHSGSDLNLAATTDADIWSLSVAGGFSGTGGIVGVSLTGAGSEANNTITNTIRAAIEDTPASGRAVTATGTITLTADDTSTIKGYAAAGSLDFTLGGLGVGGSVGASVAKNTINNSITTETNNAVVTGGSVDLTATSHATIETLAVAAAISASASMASLNLGGGGASATNTIGNTVQASIKGASSVTANGLMNGDVTLLATDQANITADVGSGALTLGMIGASIGVSIADSTIDNTVRATIDQGTVTSLHGDIDLTATATAAVDSLAVATSVAASPNGLAGAGGRSTATVTTEVAATTATGATLSAGGDIDLVARSTSTQVKAETVGVAVGVCTAVGASIATVAIGGSVDAHNNATVANATNISIDSTLTSTPTANTVAVAGGVLAGAGNSATATVDTTVNAAIGNTSITASGDVKLNATATVTAATNAVGVSVGGVGIGASIATTTIRPNVTAVIAGNTVLSAKSLALQAKTILDANAYGNASVGGGLSGNGTDVKAHVTPTITASIGANADITLTEGLSVTALSEGKAQAKGEGLTIAVAGVGVILADAVLSPTVGASIGSGTEIDAATVSVQARHNVQADGTTIDQGATSSAGASGIAGLSGQGATPSATAGAQVTAQVHSGAVLDADNSVTIAALGHNKATATAAAFSLGAAAAGASVATANAGGTTIAAMDGAISRATDLSVRARGIASGMAHTEASGGGLISGMVPVAVSTVAPIVTARIGNGTTAADINLTGNVELLAQAITNSQAEAKGLSAGGLAVGSMNALATDSATVRALIGAGTTIDSATGDIAIRALHNRTEAGLDLLQGGAKATADACGYGLAGGAGALGVATVSGSTAATIGNNAALTSTRGNIAIIADSYNQAETDVSGSSYGAAAAGYIFGAAQINGASGGTQVGTGTGVDLTAGGHITLTGQTKNVATVDGHGGTGGLLAIGGVNLTASLNQYATQVLVGAGNTLTAGTTLTAQALHSADIRAHAVQDNSVGGIMLVEVAAASLINGATTTVSIGNGTTIEAEDVVLKAQDVEVYVEATTYSKTYQAAGDTDAESTADADSTTLVELKQGVAITAPGSITLASLQENTKTIAKADTSIGEGLTGNLRSDAWNYLDANANIVTEVGTTMTTSDLLVRAQSPQINGGHVTIADTDAQTVVNYVWDVVGSACKTIWTILTFGLWDGKELCEPVMGWVRVITNSDVQGHTYGYENRSCSIQFNSNVVILGQEAKLVVNADNSMVAEGVTAIVDAAGGEVRVDDIESDGTGRVFFDSILGTLTGTASFHFNTTASVDISNYSALDLVLNDIDTFVGTADASSLTLNVSKPNMSSFHYTFQTGPGENTVTIVNFGDSSIQLNGVIDAPYGVVSVIDYGIGDIQAASGNRITARELLVDSRQGRIGADGAPLNIELVQIGLSGTVLTPEMTLLAGTDIFAQVRGVDRDDDSANAYRAVVRDLTGTGTVAVQFLDCEQVTTGTNQANVVLTALAAGNVINIDTSGRTGDDYSLSSGVVYDPTATTNQTFDPSLTTETLNPDADISNSTATSLTRFTQTFAAANASAAADTISITGHGFIDGERVIYQAGTETIGLTSGTYYVVVVNANTIQLATNAAGDMIANITAATGATANHRLTSAERLSVADASSLAVGHAVIYASTGTAIGGLTDGATYYIASLSGHDVTLAATRGGPALVINPTVATGSQTIGIADRIFCNAASSFAVGDAVVYTSGSGTSIGGLTSGTTYYVANVTGNFIQLAATYAEATAANPTVITLDSGTATGTNHQLAALRSSVQVIDTFSQAAVSGSTITLTGHSFRTGEAVVYANGGGINSIGGLTKGVTYYVVAASDTTVRLASSAANAAAGTVIALTGATGDYHTLTSLEQINLGANHGFATGDLYTYSNGGGTSIGGLTNGQTYYVIAASDTTVRLASSLTNAQAGIGIITTLTAATGDAHSLGSGDTIAISNHGFANGQEVVYRSNSGTAIGGLTNGATYYVIKLDANSFKLAATLADITATTPVAIDLDPSVATGTQHTFDLSIAIEASDSSADILRFSRGHSYQTGDAVVYHQGSSGAVSGLVDGTTYYVVKLSGSAIQLAATAADAIASAGAVNIVLQKAALGIGAGPTITVTAPAAGQSITTITLVLNTTAGSETTVQQMVDTINSSASGLLSASVAANGNLLATAGFWSTVELSSSRSSITLPFYDADTRTASGSGTFVLEHNGSGSGNLTITSGLNDIELAGAVDYGTGPVTIATAGDIVRTTADQLITAGDITLASSLGQVGDELTPILVDIGDGSLSVSAEGDIAVTEIAGDMRLGSVLSGSGDVFLSSPGAILDAEGDAAADISGNALTLTAATTVGTADNAVEIASNLLTVTAGDSVHLHEVAGNLNLNQVVSTNGDVALTAQGSILDANGSNAANIEANTIALTSLAGGIGTAGDDLEIDSSGSGEVNAQTAGGIYLQEVNGGMRVGSVVAGSGDIRLTVPDTALTGEDLEIEERIEATNGSVALHAGDNVRLNEVAVIHALHTVTLKGDAGNADAGAGAVFDLQGQISGSLVTISGDSDNDLVVLTNTVSPTEIYGLAGDDRILAGSAATPASNSGGVVDTLTGLVTVTGGEGFDILAVDDSGDNDGNIGTLTDSSITGLGMGQGILYATLEQIDVDLGSGDDRFTVNGSITGTTTLSAGLGSDVVEIQDSRGTLNIDGEAGQDELIVRANNGAVALDGGGDNDLVHIGSELGNVNGVAGPVTVTGGEGFDILAVDDSGDNDGNIGTLTDNRITGLGMGQGITYDTVERIDVDLGSGDDRFTVNGSITGTTTLSAGLGSDVVEIQDSRGTLNIDGEAGQDELIVRANNGAVALDGGGDNDLIHIGSELGNVNGVAGPVTVTGGEGFDILAVDDSGDNDGNIGTLTDSSITGLGMGQGIAYATLEQIDVDLGSGDDRFTVNGSITGTTTLSAGIGSDVVEIQDSRGTLNIDGDAGQDVLIVRANNGAVALDGGGDNDLVHIGSELGNVNGVAGPVTVTGGEGFDILAVDDSGDNDDNIGTLTDNRITGLGMGQGITYDTVERIDVDLGRGNDTMNIQSTAGATETHINGGPGDDTFNVSSDAPGHSGNLDGIRGDLHLDGGSGDNILNISDRGNTTGRTGIVIDETGITGFGDIGGGGRITYETSGTFNSLDLWLGSGRDEVTVLGAMPDAVLTLRMGGGDDQITLRDQSAVTDGLVLAFGEGGADTIDGSAWQRDLILFGDDGNETYQGGKHPENLILVEAVATSSDGPDILIGGTGNDLLVGGGAGDSLQGNPGNDILLGDYGKVGFFHGLPTFAQSTLANSGGGDTLDGGAGNDLLMGGAAGDMMYGGTGNDALIGDNGQATFSGGVFRQAGSSDFFIGGDDTLTGGAGNDFMFGGFGHDTFYGNFSEDVMIGEYGRVTLHDGKIESLVVFGQPPLDLLASTLFDLYNVEEHERTLPDITLPKWTADLAQIDDSGQQQRTLPGLSQRLSHSGSLVQMQAKQHPDAKGTGRTHSVPGPTAPVTPGGELPDNVPGLQMENPTQPAEQQSPQPMEQGQPSVDTDIRIDTPEQLEVLVAGCAGWGLATGRTPSDGTNKRLDLNGTGRKTAFWRWDRGQLQRGNVSRLREGEKNAFLPRFAVVNEATAEQRPRRVEF